MLSTTDFRRGLKIEWDGVPYEIVDFQHVKPGKGSAFVRTKYRNVKTGGVVERSFNPSDKFEQAQLERRDMNYLYSDGDLYYFMDVDTYDQVPFSASAIGDVLKFLKENMVCKVVSYRGDVFAIEPPIFVELEITDCDPGVKGGVDPVRGDCAS